MSNSPIHDEGIERLCPITTVHAFPVNYFIENIAVRRNGQLLVNVHNRSELIQVEPHSSEPPCVVEQFSANVFGIIEVEDDVFYISTGSIGEPGSFAIYKVDMSSFATAGDGKIKTPAKVSKLADVPDALFLNGSTRLGGSIILVADSILGCVFSIDVNSGEVKLWLKDKALAKVSDNPNYPGVNGIKIFKEHLYLSNTDAKTFVRTKISKNLEPSGEVELVYDRCNADDFIFDSEGTAYLTTHVFQSVIKIDSTGVRTRIAGGPSDATVAGTTAAAFGRTAKDEKILYVTTNGGMSNPVDGKIGPARVLSLDVSGA